MTPTRFDPRTESRTFTIAAADSTELILGGPLLEALPIGLIWHQRMDSDDAHRWFRTLVKTIADKAYQPPPRQRKLRS